MVHLLPFTMNSTSVSSSRCTCTHEILIDKGALRRKSRAKLCTWRRVCWRCSCCTWTASVVDNFFCLVRFVRHGCSFACLGKTTRTAVLQKFSRPRKEALAPVPDCFRTTLNIESGLTVFLSPFLKRVLLGLLCYRVADSLFKKVPSLQIWSSSSITKRRSIQHGLAHHEAKTVLRITRNHQREPPLKYQARSLCPCEQTCNEEKPETHDATVTKKLWEDLVPIVLFPHPCSWFFFFKIRKYCPCRFF